MHDKVKEKRTDWLSIWENGASKEGGGTVGRVENLILEYVTSKE